MHHTPKLGRAPLDFLTEKLDALLQLHTCSHVMIVGDLNFYMEQDTYSNFLVELCPTNHVIFSTNEPEGLLDPVITTELCEISIRCQQLRPLCVWFQVLHEGKWFK